MTTLFEEVQGAGDLNRQLDVLRPAFADWRSENAQVEQSAHERLTSILTAIYAFGLEALRDKPSLRTIAKDCQIILPGDNSAKNWWLPIVKIATGHFHETETIARKDPTIKGKVDTVRRFVPGTALIKYAIALRALESKGVPVEDVARTVEEATFTSGTVKMGRWGGIMAADRKARKDSGLVSGRKMYDANKLQKAARALLKSDTVPAAIRKAASADDVQFIAMWGFMSGDVLVPGGRIEGDVFDAKARTLAVAFADAVESVEEGPTAPGEAAELESAA